MKAFAITKVVDVAANESPLELIDLPVREPAPDEILVRVSCCGICHTELDEIEGRTPPSRYPRVPGHEVVGRVEKAGAEAKRFKIGDRVGVAWIFSSCGSCEFCTSGFENLCPTFMGTGRDADGGYAEYITVAEKYAFMLPRNIEDEAVAPLLCAGAIGYRALNLTRLRDGQTLGLYGFGASGHLVLKMVRYLFPGSKIYIFSRSNVERSLALELGADWAGDISDTSPTLPDSIIDTTPAWKPSIDALAHLKPGGRLVINAIRKEDSDKASILLVSYPDHIWMEKELKSVANITRKDVEEFLSIAAKASIRPEVQLYDFHEANRAIRDLKKGNTKGAKVLMIKS